MRFTNRIAPSIRWNVLIKDGKAYAFQTKKVANNKNKKSLQIIDLQTFSSETRN